MELDDRLDDDRDYRDSQFDRIAGHDTYSIQIDIRSDGHQTWPSHTKWLRITPEEFARIREILT
jgi:hypothetical protein